MNTILLSLPNGRSKQTSLHIYGIIDGFAVQAISSLIPYLTSGYYLHTAYMVLINGYWKGIAYLDNDDPSLSRRIQTTGIEFLRGDLENQFKAFQITKTHDQEIARGKQDQRGSSRVARNHLTFQPARAADLKNNSDAITLLERNLMGTTGALSGNLFTRIGWVKKGDGQALLLTRGHEASVALDASMSYALKVSPNAPWSFLLSVYPAQITRDTMDELEPIVKMMLKARLALPPGLKKSRRRFLPGLRQDVRNFDPQANARSISYRGVYFSRSLTKDWIDIDDVLPMPFDANEQEEFPNNELG